MTSIIARIFNGALAAPASPSRGDIAYAKAIASSDDLIRRMQEASRSKDAVRAVMADIWAQRHNVPFMTTVVEAVQEAKSPVAQSPYDTLSGPPTPKDDE
jgi:hypothetical protein